MRAICQALHGVAASIVAAGLAMNVANAATWHVEAEATVASDRNPGTVALPLRTLGEAMRRLGPGDEVIVGDGIYREAIVVPPLKVGRDGGATLIRARNPGRAIVRGSNPVNGWVPMGDGRFAVDWPHPEPAQVFVGGLPLRQRGGTVFGGYPVQPKHQLADAHRAEGGIWLGRRPGGVADLQPGDFIHDASARRLVVRLPASAGAPADVEVGVRPYLLVADDARRLHLDGLIFEHANTSSLARHGALQVKGSDNVISRIVIRHVDAIGLQFTGHRGRLEDSLIEHCGQMGLNVRGREFVVTGNRFVHNNTRGFNKWWEAGGVKVIGDGGLHDSVFAANVFAFNRGDGLWIDWLNSNIRIEHNIAAFNDGFGIHYEASRDGVIIDNASYGNAQRGIYLFESTDSRVEGNVVLANGLEGIAIAEGERARNQSALRPRGNHVLRNIIGWNRNVELMLAPQGLEAASDHNTLLSERAAGLVRGWVSIGNRPSRGLNAWRLQSGLDLHSSERIAPRPAMLDALLAQRRLVSAEELRLLIAASSAGRQPTGSAP